MASQYITNLVQKAIEEFLETQSLPAGLQVYKGIERPAAELSANEEPVKTLPCVQCICQSAEVDAPYSGSWFAHATVIVRTNADDTDEDTHHTLAATIFDMLMTDTIETDLSALAGFTAHQCTPVRQAWQLNERSWESVYDFDISCSPSDIS